MGYGPLGRMTESSSVIEKSVIEKFLEIERGGGRVSACGKQNIP